MQACKLSKIASNIQTKTVFEMKLNYKLVQSFPKKIWKKQAVYSLRLPNWGGQEQEQGRSRARAGAGPRRAEAGKGRSRAEAGKGRSRAEVGTGHEQGRSRLGAGTEQE